MDVNIRLFLVSVLVFRFRFERIFIVATVVIYEEQLKYVYYENCLILMTVVLCIRYRYKYKLNQIFLSLSIFSYKYSLRSLATFDFCL